MMDEIYDRTYQAGRADLNAGLDRLFKRTVRSVDNAFQVIHRIEFDAPWSKRTKGPDCA